MKIKNFKKIDRNINAKPEEYHTRIYLKNETTLLNIVHGYMTKYITNERFKDYLINKLAIGGSYEKYNPMFVKCPFIDSNGNEMWLSYTPLILNNTFISYFYLKYRNLYEN